MPLNKPQTLMDPIKIIVTNSDATYLEPPPPSNIHYEESRNVIASSESDHLPSGSHNATTSSSASTLKSSNRWNLPPLKISTNEHKSFKLPSDDDHIDNNMGDDSQKLLLSPLLGKSLTTSQSTTSLNKRVTISPSAPRIDSLNVTGKYQNRLH